MSRSNKIKEDNPHRKIVTILTMIFVLSMVIFGTALALILKFKVAMWIFSIAGALGAIILGIALIKEAYDELYDMYENYFEKRKK
jgi:hypothetical protein